MHWFPSLHVQLLPPAPAGQLLNNMSVFTTITQPSLINLPSLSLLTIPELFPHRCELVIVVSHPD